jgi:AbrB family looped-hinge helix DNA binding protein
MNVKAKLTSKGQLTVPVEVRTRLNLQAGDMVEFQVEDLNVIRLSPVPQPKSSQGVLSRLRGKTPVSIEKMDQAIKDQPYQDRRSFR